MMVIASFCFLIFLKNCHQTSGLLELRAAPDNDILRTAVTVRDTVNDIFKGLNIDPSAKNKPQIEYFSPMHKYLDKLSSRDYANLKEISRLAHDSKTIDKTNDNVANITAVLDEILNQIINTNGTENKPTKNIELTSKIEDSATPVPVSSIKELDNNYELDTIPYDLDLNNIDVDDLIKHFKFNETIFYNATLDDQAFEDTDSEENSTINNDGEVWMPSGRRVYKGKRTNIKHFPFMVTVNIFGKFQCAGSIISADLIITACSCVQLAYNNRFFRENPMFLSVRIGSSFYVGGGEIISVTEVHFHPNYDPPTLKNNLALLRLQKHIRFRKHGKGKRVKKIALDTKDHPLPMNTDGVTIVGWGAMSKTNKIKDPWLNKLAYAVLDIYSLEDCKDIYTSAYVTKKNFCAGFISKGGGACNRDVGAPGIVDGVLTGVVSFGSTTCGEFDSPTVFTKIGYYIDWIEAVMDQDVATYFKKSEWPSFTFSYPVQTTTIGSQLVPVNPEDANFIDHPLTDLDIRPKEPKETILLVSKSIEAYGSAEINKVERQNLKLKKEKKTTSNKQVNAAFDDEFDETESTTKKRKPKRNTVNSHITKLMADSKEIRIEEKLIDELIDSVIGKNSKDDYENLLREENEKEKKAHKAIVVTTKRQVNKITKRDTVAPELDIAAFMAMFVTKPLFDVQNDRVKVTKRRIRVTKKHVPPLRFTTTDRSADQKRSHAPKSNNKIAREYTDTLIKPASSNPEAYIVNSKVERETKAVSPKLDNNYDADIVKPEVKQNKAVLLKPGGNLDKDIEEVLFYLGTLYETTRPDVRKSVTRKTVQIKTESSEGMSIELFNVQRREQYEDEQELDDSSLDRNDTDKINATYFEELNDDDDDDDNDGGIK